MVIAVMDIESYTSASKLVSTFYIEKALQKQLIYKDEFDKYNRPIKRCEIAQDMRTLNIDE